MKTKAVDTPYKGSWAEEESRRPKIIRPRTHFNLMTNFDKFVTIGTFVLTSSVKTST
jgi:hypothetical protein